MTALPVQRASQLAARAEEHRWLIEGLWAAEAVGIVGGEPKCCKSFLALDMAVSVAAGTPCLRRFAVPAPGRVLLYAAEDAQHVVRLRLDGIAQAAGIALDQLDIQVITSSSLRLDLDADQERLEETIDTLRPRLLILDPFVRLHRIDENASAEVAPLLAFLRDLQRRYAVAVAVVHHARKGAGKARQGQALRGSSEFHAWGDSNLYLRRIDEALSLSVEHRAAPSTTGQLLTLHADGPRLALQVLDRIPAASPRDPPNAPSTPADTILQILRAAAAPLPLARLRTACHMRTATLCDNLAQLTEQRKIHKTPAGYQLVLP